MSDEYAQLVDPIPHIAQAQSQGGGSSMGKAAGAAQGSRIASERTTLHSSSSNSGPGRSEPS